MPEGLLHRACRPWLVGGILAGLMLGGAWLARAPILSRLARPLVADDAVGPACYLWVHSEDGVFPDATPCYSVAARLYREHDARRILLVDTQPPRLSQLGVLPPFAAAAQRRLKARGVPEAAVEVLSGAQRGLAAELPVLARFLESHAAAEVQLLAGRFDSGACRCTIDRLLAPGQAARVKICAVPHPDYNETSWWLSRAGVREFLLAWIKRIYGGAAEQDQPAPWNPDAYERSLAGGGAGDRP